MKVFSEELIFHQTFWTTTTTTTTTTTSTEEFTDRSSPCPPASSNTTSSRPRNFEFRPIDSSCSSVPSRLSPILPAPDKFNAPRDQFFNDQAEEKDFEPKRVLEPLPTFVRHEWYPTAFSHSPPSSPSALPLSPLPSPVFTGFGSGPSVEVRGVGVSRVGPLAGFREDAQSSTYDVQNVAAEPPIQLAPLRFPPCFDHEVRQIQQQQQQQFKLANFMPMTMDTDRAHEEERSKKDKTLGIAPVIMKKKSSSTPGRGKKPSTEAAQVIVDVLRQQMTSSKMASSTSTSAPSSPVRSNNNSHCGDNGRKRVTPEQLAILEAAFEQGMIPDLDTRRKLADRLGFTERRVQIWFQNRRAKLKKDNHGTPVFIINCGIESFKN